jgi:hypothetical protein
MSKQINYGKKTSFSRERHHVCSEADIARVENKINQWKDIRREEREKNLKLAAGELAVGELAVGELAVGEPEEQKETKEPKKIKQQTNDIYDYAEEAEEEIWFSPKMKLVMHDIPLSFNIDNVLRSFMYYGDIAYVKSVSNHISPTYSVTAVPNEWNENIAEIQANIAKNGFAMIGDYRVTEEK